MEDTLARAGINTPRVSEAIDDINARCNEMMNQIQVLMSRSEHTVKQDQLRQMQQAMMTLEGLMKEKRRASGSGEAPAMPPVAPRRVSDGSGSMPLLDAAPSGSAAVASLATVAAAAVGEDVLNRLKVLEDQVRHQICVLHCIVLQGSVLGL